jgi:hypothetical protein
MSQPLDDYLARVARELRSLPAPVRENELKEVRSHLEQLIEDNIAQGQSRDAATQSSLATFGRARAVGIGVRDVLEGQETGWKPWVTAFVRGFLFWMVGFYALVIGFISFQSSSQSALLPEATDYVFIAGFVAVPFLTGAIHALYLGRRAWGISATIYSAFWMAEVVSGARPSLTIVNFHTSFWGCNLVLGVAGALMTDIWLRRRRYAVLALAGMASSASSLTLQSRSHVRLSWKLLLIPIVPLALVMAAKQRLNAAAHPQSATEAVRIYLLTARDASKMAAPSIIRLDEIPPTQAELSAGMRRVRFEVVCHMTSDYQQRRRAFLQAQLAISYGRQRWGAKNLHASLRRVRANAFTFSGVARVKHQPSEWQIERDNNYYFNHLWGWAEDVYFQAAPSSASSAKP